VKVAILPWGDVIEHYLDTIGTDVEAFATEMEGGWLFGYADALAEAGVETCLVIVSRDARETRRIVNPRTGVRTIVLPSPTAYRACAQSPLARVRHLAPWLALPGHALAAALRAEGCTHVIMQEYEDPRFDRLVPLARRLGLPVVASFQGGQTEPGTALGRAVRRRSIRSAAGLVIASSVETERVLRRYGHDLRIGRIFNPVDRRTWYPEDRAACRTALGLPDSARIAVCHCRIDMRRKGIDVLLAAWRIVAGRLDAMDLRLHLIGDGPDRDDLRDEIARAPVRGLRWVDTFLQDRAAMRQELCAADLHVQASRHEGFAVAPMEAMSCGLPTVLSRAPGAADLLEQGEASGGLVVPVGDASALADAIEALLTDDARRIRMAAAARDHVQNVAATGTVGRQLADFLAASTGR
jgi:glycosyltransferase involved in cell wall biosynthesis